MHSHGDFVYTFTKPCSDGTAGIKPGAAQGLTQCQQPFYPLWASETRGDGMEAYKEAVFLPLMGV